jgi:hypothetical protein
MAAGTRPSYYVDGLLTRTGTRPTGAAEHSISEFSAGSAPARRLLRQGAGSAATPADGCGMGRQRRISRSIPEGLISDEEVPAIHGVSSARKWRSCWSSRHWLTAEIVREYAWGDTTQSWRLWTISAFFRRRTDLRAQTDMARPHSVWLLSVSRRNDL